MSDAPSLVLLTTIEPDPRNHGGPSGLPWEILQELIRDGWQVHVQLVPLPTGRLRRRAMQLAMPLALIPVDRMNADAYIAYPSYIGRLVPSELHSKTLALGPDATSMLYARFARIESGWRRCRSRCLSRWFVFYEQWITKHLAGIAVVGRNDARWLRRIAQPALRQNVLYVPHPVLRRVTRELRGVSPQARPRLIFGGDLSRKYIGNFFESLDQAAVATCLRLANCEVLVVGKGNRPIYDIISDRLPARYEAWVDDYAILCDPLRDVHAMPLLAGAGTKNRTLTALAMNVIVLSTPIGIENIDTAVLCAATVHRFRSASQFPVALTAALRDLQTRRHYGLPPPAPPMGRIDDAFRAAARHAVRSVAANSFPSPHNP